jgi:hypothetical protein
MWCDLRSLGPRKAPPLSLLALETVILGPFTQAVLFNGPPWIIGECKSIRDIRGGEERRDSSRTTPVTATQIWTGPRETLLLGHRWGDGWRGRHSTVEEVKT